MQIDKLTDEMSADQIEALADYFYDLAIALLKEAEKKSNKPGKHLKLI